MPEKLSTLDSTLLVNLHYIGDCSVVQRVKTVVNEEQGRPVIPDINLLYTTLAVNDTYLHECYT